MIEMQISYKYYRNQLVTVVECSLNKRGIVNGHSFTKRKKKMVTSNYSLTTAYNETSMFKRINDYICNIFPDF